MLKRPGEPDPSVVHSFEQHWPNIQPVVERLIHQEPISKSQWQNLFHEVHTICSWDELGCQKLLGALEDEFSYLNEIRESLTSVEDGQQQLKEYVTSWLEFNHHCQRFSVAFQQLDLAASKDVKYLAVQITRGQRGGIVRNMMLKLWNLNVVMPLRNRLQNSSMDLLTAERDGKLIDPHLIVELRNSFSCLNSEYVHLFELRYLQDIEIYYSSQAHERLKSQNVLDYIKWATSKLISEEWRVERYLNQQSKQKVLDVCTKILISNFVDQIVEEFPRYLSANDLPSVNMIFYFVDRVNGCAEKLFYYLSNHLVTTTMSLLLASGPSISSNSEKYVGMLVETYNRFHQIIATSFNNDPRAKAILDPAFAAVINDTRIFQTIDTDSGRPTQTESKAAELLANYCDLLLRKTSLSRKFTASDIRDQLQSILPLIKLINNKESFLKFHKSHLTRRLILNTTSSVESEEQFVKNLRELPGVPSEQIFKLVRMFKDLKASEELQKQFEKTLHVSPYPNELSPFHDNNNTIQTLESQVGNLAINRDDIASSNRTGIERVQIKVINPSAWMRTKEKFPITLPRDIGTIIPLLEEFYCKQHNGRKLEWCHQLSNGTLSFTNKKGKFDLDVTLAQLVVLSAFNSRPGCSMTFEALETVSSLSPLELRKTLWVSEDTPVQLTARCEQKLTMVPLLPVSRL